MSYDVIVVGLGAVGSAAAHTLSKQGARVLGIDRYHPPHTLGSSHGETRIARLAVGEGAAYLPLARRSYDLWRELEAQTGEHMFVKCGGIILCPAENSGEFHGKQNFVDATAALASQEGIPHHRLSSDELADTLPMFALPPNQHAYHEPGAGLALPEPIIRAQLALAQQHGAVLHTGECVASYTWDTNGVTVTTDGSTYHAGKLILTAGAWIGDLLPTPLRGQLKIYRQVIYWFDVDDLSMFHARQFPWVLWIGRKLGELLGVFSYVDGGTPGLKVLTEQYETTTDAHTLDRTVHPHEVDAMYDRFIAGKIAGVRRTVSHTAACMYTVTSDEGFLIDHHPETDRVLYASPCSGHGYKHAAAVGEALAQVTLDGTSDIDLSTFRAGRLLGV